MDCSFFASPVRHVHCIFISRRCCSRFRSHTNTTHEADKWLGFRPVLLVALADAELCLVSMDGLPLVPWRVGAAVKASARSVGISRKNLASHHNHHSCLCRCEM
jgi:hypothetical protein